jgi:hypothetical protein
MLDSIHKLVSSASMSTSTSSMTDSISNRQEDALPQLTKIVRRDQLEKEESLLQTSSKLKLNHGDMRKVVFLRNSL